MSRSAVVLGLFLWVTVCSADSFAQAPKSDPMSRIVWQDPGAYGNIGTVARVLIPSGCRFTNGDGARLFAEAVQNIPDPESLGLLLCQLAVDSSGTGRGDLWFAEYTFSADGYIKDAASEKLDPKAILESIKEATRRGNEERQKRGWATMEVVGWQRLPFYDPKTSNATWSLLGHSTDNEDAINHRVRLLGRRGVLAINMISSPTSYEAAVVGLDKVMANTGFVSGERYSEFRRGDKIAEYGLTALIAGGAGAAAVKFGLFGKLWKLLVGFAVAAWKLLVAAVVGLFSWVASLFKRKGRTQEGDAPHPPSGSP